MGARVLIADQHAAFRHDLAFYVTLLDGGYEVVGETGSAAGLLARIAALRPDVLLIDVELPDAGGLALTRRISREWPRVRVLVIGNNPAADYRQAALDAGAAGYIDKLELGQELPAALAELTRPLPAPAPAHGEEAAAPLTLLRARHAADGAATLAPAPPLDLLAAGLGAWGVRRRRLPAAVRAALVARFGAVVAYLNRGPLTAWQCLHMVLAIVCLQFSFGLRSLQPEDLAGRELPLVIILTALLGIGLLELRQVSRIRLAARAARTRGGRDGN